jgi:plastocyanin
MRTRALVVVCCLAAFAGGCTKTLNSTGVENQVKEKLERLGQTGMTVDCPDDIEVKAGATFTCTATGSSGTTVTIEVTQKDDQGNLDATIVDGS